VLLDVSLLGELSVGTNSYEYAIVQNKDGMLVTITLSHLMT